MDGGCQGPATEAPPGRELLGVQPAGPPRREVGPASAAVTARTTREGPAQRLQPDAGGGPAAPLPHELLPPTWPRRRRGERPPPRRTTSACPCALPGPEEGGGPAAEAAPVTAPSSRRAQPASCGGRTSRDQPEHRVRHSRARESPDLGAGPRGPGWLPACRGGAGADAPRHTRPPRAAGSLRQPGRGGRGQGGGRAQALTGTRGPKSREPRWSLSPRLISLAVFPLRLSDGPVGPSGRVARVSVTPGAGPGSPGHPARQPPGPWAGDRGGGEATALPAGPLRLPPPLVTIKTKCPSAAIFPVWPICF